MITFGAEPAPSNIPNPSSEKQSRNKLLISSAVFASLIVSPIIFALPALLNGRTLLPPGDMGGLFDVHILIGKILSNGQLPLWNSYAQAGMPLIAAAYTGALNPLNWVFVFFSPVAAPATGEKNISRGSSPQPAEEINHVERVDIFERRSSDGVMAAV